MYEESNNNKEENKIDFFQNKSVPLNSTLWILEYQNNLQTNKTLF